MAREASSPDLSLTREATGQHDSEPNDARTADVLDAGNCILGGEGKKRPAIYWAYKLNVSLKADVNLHHDSSPYCFSLIEALLNWAKQNNNLFGPEPPKPNTISTLE